MRQKRLMILFFYLALLAACAGIVWLLGRLNSPVEPKTPSVQESEYPGQTEPSEEETPAGETEGEESLETEPETEIEEMEVSGRPEGTDKPRGQTEETPPYEPPRLMLVSDLHYMSGSTHDEGKAFWNLVKSDDGKAHQYSEQLLEALAARALEEKPSALVLSGDITLNGEKENHLELAKKLKEIQDGGVPVVVIPGNHDINNPHAASYFGEVREAAESVSAEDFLDIYHEFGYDQAISRDETSLSYICELDEKNWLMMLDSAQYEPVNLVGGRIRSTTVKWMEEQLEAAKELGISVIPIAHHNLLKESILYPVDCTLENSDEVIKLLERYRVPVFISGHLHLQRTKKYKPEPGEPEDAYHISEIVADSFAIPPCQYGILSWGDGGQLRYTTKEADMERYAAAHGLTDENLLNFKEYGTDFLVGVISQQIYKKMSSLPEEHMRKMAELYGQLNRDYCAGTPIDVKEIKSDEAFRLWERNLPDSRMFEEIDDILRDTRKDHNTWDFPGEW